MAVRIGDLVETVGLVSADTPLSVGISRFQADSSSTCFTVVRDRKPIGLLHRHTAMEIALSVVEGGADRICAGDIAETTPVLLDARLKAAQVAIQYRKDDYARLRAGAFVKRDGRYVGVLSFAKLMKAIALENAARAKAMKTVPDAAPEPAAAPEPEPETTLAAEPPAAASAPVVEASATKDVSVQSLMATLVHEVRTPLTGIMGMAEILDGRLQRTDNRDMAQSIVQSGEILNHILKDTLDYASLQAGALPQRSEASDLNDLAVELRREWATKASKKGLGLHIAYNPGGPPKVDTDLRRIRQICDILIRNALRHTRQGQISVSISTSPLSDQHMLSVEIADSGRGTDDEMYESIQSAFASGAALQSVPGWGLGLTICNAFARHLGGQMQLDRNPGGGNLFTLTLPVKAALPVAKKDSRSDRPKSGQFALGEVLLIEDHEACALIVMDALEQAGWHVRHAATLTCAREALAEQSYQAILTDLHLTDGNALTLIDELRRQGGVHGDVPILALTADGTDGSKQACLAMGADRALKKPLYGPELVATLADVLMTRASGALTNGQLRGRLAS
ncbi:MAG: ATP-binding protein [Henriciella sp.]|nr:ATP-binding protein [Henriciella sp.]